MYIILYICKYDCTCVYMYVRIEVYIYICVYVDMYVCYYRYINVCIFVYTGCPGRKGSNFWRVFLKSNYTDITQNTYIQCSMFTEILASEECGSLLCLRTVPCT